MKSRSERTRLSRVRQSLRRLSDEAATLVDVFSAAEPMARGSVYEIRRKCGKPSCVCATQGRLHASKVVSWSEGGRTQLRTVPKGSLVELRILTKRYQRFRKARARLVKLHGEMLELMGQLEAARIVELPIATSTTQNRSRRTKKVRGRVSRGEKGSKPRNKRSTR